MARLVAVLFAAFLVSAIVVDSRPNRDGIRHRRRREMSTTAVVAATVESQTATPEQERTTAEQERTPAPVPPQMPLVVYVHLKSKCKPRVHNLQVIPPTQPSCRVFLRTRMCSGSCESYAKASPIHGFLTETTCSCCRATQTETLKIVIDCRKHRMNRGRGWYRLYRGEMALDHQEHYMEVVVPVSCACKKMECGQL